MAGVSTREVEKTPQKFTKRQRADSEQRLLCANAQEQILQQTAIWVVKRALDVGAVNAKEMGVDGSSVSVEAHSGQALMNLFGFGASKQKGG